MLIENETLTIVCLVVGGCIVAGALISFLKKRNQRNVMGWTLLIVGFICMFAALLFVPLQSNRNEQGDTILLSGNISDTLVFDELEITVTDVVFSQYLGNLEGLTEADNGNVWCVVYFDIKNISKSAKSLKTSFGANYNVILQYKDGYTYYGTYSDFSEFLFAHDTISALETLENVCVSFKVPLGVKENTEETLSVQFSYNSKTENDYVEWKLR